MGLDWDLSANRVALEWESGISLELLLLNVLLVFTSTGGVDAVLHPSLVLLLKNVQLPPTLNLHPAPTPCGQSTIAAKGMMVWS